MQTRRLGVIILVLSTLTTAEVGAQEQETLRERVRVLEERLDKLEKTEVIKKVVEYICPDGEIHDQLPAGGRCPDGSTPEERATFRKLKFALSEPLAGRIAGMIEEAEARRVVLGGSARGILQQAVNSRSTDKLFGEGAVDLFVLAKPMVFTTFFADLEAIGGMGPDEGVGSLSRLNTDAETLGPGATDQVKVREAWLHHRAFQDYLEVAAGKVDLTAYFDRNAVANDETTKFLNTALVNNPMLKQPPNGPGGIIIIDTARDLMLRLGVQSSNNLASMVSEKVFAIAEVDYHTHALFGREGNVRVWGRTGRIGEALDRETWGAGLSLDQQLTPTVTAFTRGGFSRIAGDNRTDWAASAGLEWQAPVATRRGDRTGIAVSTQEEAGGAESIGEWYYQAVLTEGVSISPDLQWLFSGPNQVTGERNESVLIPGVRMTVTF